MLKYAVLGGALVVALAACEPDPENLDEGAPPPPGPALENAAVTAPAAGTTVLEDSVVYEVDERED